MHFRLSRRLRGNTRPSVLQIPRRTFFNHLNLDKEQRYESHLTPHQLVARIVTDLLVDSARAIFCRRSNGANVKRYFLPAR